MALLGMIYNSFLDSQDEVKPSRSLAQSLLDARSIDVGPIGRSSTRDKNTVQFGDMKKLTEDQVVGKYKQQNGKKPSDYLFPVAIAVTVITIAYKAL
jgi:hypothetical protein